ncbi:anthranilate synthase component II [Aestuariivirga litoralis]|uniref:anthranilate synthase component II n=1 Tax=Aestuariivirga litoralis TaxID=2650924 RepID=UPI0018C728AA|nr:aminodeoxychorismate/anthranilate synthase component II [Aestuariivirga litoralis]MBG1231660.1 aminodeoxychorismate/anthranilate synthase component II [Aestuariivirga litoralis]
MIILIDNYDSFTWNLYHYLGDLGAETVVHRNDKISVGQVISAEPEAIVISPGPGTPDKAGIIIDLVKEASGKIPVFGVCLGLQAIGEAFGGKVVRAPSQMHGKVSQVRHDSKGVFAALPQDFAATRYHSLVVDRESLPSELEVTAETDGIIMGLQHRTLNVHGVQFHPESIASEHGHLILKNFLDKAKAEKSRG